MPFESARRARNESEPARSLLLKVRRLSRRNTVLPQRLGPLQRRAAGFQQRIEGELALALRALGAGPESAAAEVFSDATMARLLAD